MKIGYARISTTDQKMHLQIDALEKAGCENVFRESASGSKTERAELESAFEKTTSGDTLVVWKLDRLGRSLRDVIDFVERLSQKGVGFQSLTDGIDTSSPTGKFFFHIIGAFSELERDLIRERTRAGLIAAKKRGRVGGQPRAIDPKTFKSALSLYKSNDLSIREICTSLNINSRTLARYLAKYRTDHPGELD